MKKNRFKAILLDTLDDSHCIVKGKAKPHALYYDKLDGDSCVAQHLYILDTQAEIKEGEYRLFIPLNVICISYCYETDNKQRDYIKVLATTDDSLSNCNRCNGGGEVGLSKKAGGFGKKHCYNCGGTGINKLLPQIQPDFIKQLITKLNNKEDIVIDVEMGNEPIFKPTLVDDVGLAYNATDFIEQPKLTDNFIHINFIEPKSILIRTERNNKSYSLEEVKHILRDFSNVVGLDSGYVRDYIKNELINSN